MLIFSGATTKNRCYGCALAATEHCLTLLRVMATFAPCRWYLIHKQGVLQELVNHNLRGGTHQVSVQLLSFVIFFSSIILINYSLYHF